MCSKAKAVQKAQRDEEEARETKREVKIQAEIQENVQLRAKRFAAATDITGLDDYSPIYTSDYGQSMMAGKLREWAVGYFDQDDRLYLSTFNARDFSDPVRLAKDLGCSTDYLLGVTDELTGPLMASTSVMKQARETVPNSGDDDGPWHWWPEQPQKSGLYWYITGPMSQGGSLYWRSAEKERWEHVAMAFPLSLTVTIWVRCPRPPESMDWERREDPNGEE